MFAQRLKKLLDSSGKTQKDLAAFIGVKQNTVSDWVNKGTSPKVEHIYRIVDFFSISFDFLFSESQSSTIVNAKDIIEDKLATDERTIITIYREIDDEGKDLVQHKVREIWADHRQPKGKSSTSSKDELIG